MNQKILAVLLGKTEKGEVSVIDSGVPGEMRKKAVAMTEEGLPKGFVSVECWYGNRGRVFWQDGSRIPRAEREKRQAAAAAKAAESADKEPPKKVAKKKVANAAAE